MRIDDRDGNGAEQRLPGQLIFNIFGGFLYNAKVEKSKNVEKTGKTWTNARGAN